MTNSNPTSSHSQPSFANNRADFDRSPSVTHSVTPTALDDTITTRRATADEIAFRDGYVKGREQERRIQEHAQRRMQHFYAHQGMVGGLLTGIMLTLTVGFIATMLAVYSPQWEIRTMQNTSSQPIR
jgi:hypothetical protein